MCAVAVFFTTTLIAARSTVLATDASPSRGMTDTTLASEAKGRTRP